MPTHEEVTMSQPQSQSFWDVTMMQAKQAYERRQWATLDMLLHQASAARDAPPWDEDREDVRTWEDLFHAVTLHQIDAHTHIRAAVHLMLVRLQDYCGAAGAPDPTMQDLCGWLRAEVETLDMDAVDEAAEERWRDYDIPRRYLRTNLERDESWSTRTEDTPCP
jgi:hypothetical protein